MIFSLLVFIFMGYVTSESMTICEWWMEKNVETSGHGLYERNRASRPTF